MLKYIYLINLKLRSSTTTTNNNSIQVFGEKMTKRD